jgi:8-oxo-dGTP diphosphatase
MTNISIGVVVREGKVLLVKRTIKEGDLDWQFPAGKIDPNEKPSEAVCREVFEETNIFCTPVKYIGDRMVSENLCAHYFICQFIGGQLKPNSAEVKKAKWKSVAEVNRLIKTNIYKPVKQYLNSLEKNNRNIVPIG